MMFILRWSISCIAGHRPYTSRNLCCHVKFWHSDIRITYIRQLLLFLLLNGRSLAFLSSHFDEVCALFAWGHRWWVDSHLTLKRAIQHLAPVLEIEMSVWVDGLIRSLCLTVRPRHVHTTIVICEDMVTQADFRHARFTHLNSLAIVVAWLGGAAVLWLASSLLCKSTRIWTVTHSSLSSNRYILLVNTTLESRITGDGRDGWMILWLK